MDIRNLPFARTIAGLLVTFALGAPALAQHLTLPLTPISSPPLAPTNLTNGDFVGRRAGLTPLVLQWGQFFPSGGGLFLYPPATHFVICFRANTGGTSPPCTMASHDYEEVIATPTTRLTRTGNNFRFAPGGPVQDAQLDQPFRFTVGACTALVERSCRYAAADVYYSSRNIVADTVGVDSTTTTSHWRLNAQASNPGDSEIPGFSGTVELLEALPSGISSSPCVTDVDDASRRSDGTLVVIDKWGGRKAMAEVSRDASGHYNGPEIAGLFRLLTFSTSMPFTTGSTALAARQMSSRGVAVVDFPIAVGPVQKTFVAIATLDTAGDVREYDENDNVRAKCRAR